MYIIKVFLNTNNFIKKILFFTFIQSFGTTNFHLLIHYLLYFNIDKFGFYKLGYSNITDMSLFISNCHIIATIFSAISIFLLFYIKNYNKIKLFGSCLCIMSVLYFVLSPTNKAFYLLFICCNQLRMILNKILTMHMINNNVNIYNKKNIFFLNYFIRNVGAGIGIITSSYIKYYINLYFFCSITMFLYSTSYFLIMEKNNIQKEKNNNKNSWNISKFIKTLKVKKIIGSYIFTLTMFKLILDVSVYYQNTLLHYMCIFTIYILLIIIAQLFGVYDKIIALVYINIIFKVYKCMYNMIGTPLIPWVESNTYNYIFGYSFPGSLIIVFAPITIITMSSIIQKTMSCIEDKYKTQFFNFIYKLIIIVLCSMLLYLIQIEFNQFTYSYIYSQIALITLITLYEIIALPKKSYFSVLLFPAAFIGSIELLEYFYLLIGIKNINFLSHTALTNNSLFPLSKLLIFYNVILILYYILFGKKVNYVINKSINSQKTKYQYIFLLYIIQKHKTLCKTN
ncbi:hypothetical protein AB837_00046 [bacterium AB1]|nr:hypothetical protein AB837_00046 [bacterium AB1]